MKKKAYFLCLLLFANVLIATAENNLLVNSGFEEVDNKGWAIGWIQWTRRLW